ncbi:expressed protein [Aureococcus anophagefferens]|uniref:Expressed protein n=1 Tax=Aureococcus anophagefferens TaxID=44056 RepID=F0YRR2_AURAN|nr:expressed protein [Aureococcus anophagefferens]EGB02197.1 expressed protein [Aureococcus anophagefferens]|eukprot:XP_009043104.1 expressed protein [Aureococcus anophagefferens]
MADGVVVTAADAAAVRRMQVDLGRWLAPAAADALDRSGAVSGFYIAPPAAAWPPPGWPPAPAAFEPFGTPWVELRRRVSAAVAADPGLALRVAYERRGERRVFERSADGALAPGSDPELLEPLRGLRALVFSKARSEGEAMALAWCAALVVPEDRLSPSSKSKDAGLEGLARGVESGAMGEAVALALRTTGEALRAANVPRSFERAIVETARRFCLEPVAAVAAVAKRAADLDVCDAVLGLEGRGAAPGPRGDRLAAARAMALRATAHAARTAGDGARVSAVDAATRRHGNPAAMGDPLLGAFDAVHGDVAALLAAGALAAPRGAAPLDDHNKAPPPPGSAKKSPLAALLGSA